MRGGGDGPRTTKQVVPTRADVYYECLCPYQASAKIERRTVSFDRIVGDPVASNENFHRAAQAIAAIIQPDGACRGREFGDADQYRRCSEMETITAVCK